MSDPVREEQIEAIMAYFGVTEREARWIAAVDAGEIPGDVIEIDEDEADTKDDETSPES